MHCVKCLKMQLQGTFSSHDKVTLICLEISSVFQSRIATAK